MAALFFLKIIAYTVRGVKKDVGIDIVYHNFGVEGGGSNHHILFCFHKFHIGTACLRHPKVMEADFYTVDIPVGGELLFQRFAVAEFHRRGVVYIIYIAVLVFHRCGVHKAVLYIEQRKGSNRQHSTQTDDVGEDFEY